MARELVINEYIDRRAQEHNEWLGRSSELWKTQRMTLAYPVIPPYPTEKEIIVRANALMEFLLTVEDAVSPAAELTTPAADECDGMLFGEGECLNMSEDITQAIDDSFEPDPSDEKYSSRLPQIMKSVQDIKRFMGAKK